MAREVQLAELVATELVAFRAARDRADTNAAWHALERTHIVAQPLLGPHLRVHATMLGYALRLRQPGEVAGQLFRILLAPLGHLTGRIPTGNTGRSNMSAFEPMPIPDDLRRVLDQAEHRPS